MSDRPERIVVWADPNGEPDWTWEGAVRSEWTTPVEYVRADLYEQVHKKMLEYYDELQKRNR